jgi:hypothetical protein
MLGRSQSHWQVSRGITIELETRFGRAHGTRMADSEEEPVMLPFQDKGGAGWHVVIRFHEGHERRIDGFATEKEALDWIVTNSKQVDK